MKEVLFVRYMSRYPKQKINKVHQEKLASAKKYEYKT